MSCLKDQATFRGHLFPEIPNLIYGYVHFWGWAILQQWKRLRKHYLQTGQCTQRSFDTFGQFSWWENKSFNCKYTDLLQKNVRWYFIVSPIYNFQDVIFQLNGKAKLDCHFIIVHFCLLTKVKTSILSIGTPPERSPMPLNPHREKGNSCQILLFHI